MSEPYDSEPNRVEVLKRHVDPRLFQTAPTAPAWVKALAGLAGRNAAALALSGPSGVSVSSDTGSRIRSHVEVPALYLAAVADTIAKTHGRLALGYPPGALHLPLLFAVATILSSAIYRGLQRISAPGPVLVVSPDLDLRSRYCDIFVKDLPLDEAYYGTRLAHSGSREALSGRRVQSPLEGVCFFLPTLALPSSLNFKPQLVIVDLRHSRWTRRLEALLDWTCQLGSSILGIYTLGDPDAEAAFGNKRIAKLPIDHGALAAFPSVESPRPDPLTIDWSFRSLRNSLQRHHEIKHVPQSEEVDRALLQCREMIEKERAADQGDANRIRWVIATLRQMPVPVCWYESVARDMGRSTLRRLISQIGYRSRRSASAGPVLQTIRMTLESVYDKLNAANPRVEAVQVEIAALLERYPPGKLLVLARDRVAEKALNTWLDLEAFPAGQTAEVTVRSGVSWDPGATEVECVLVNGAFPRRYRWLAGCLLGRRVLFLVYPHEAEVVVQHLKLFYDPTNAEARAKERAATLRSLQGIVFDSKGGPDVPPPPLSLEQPTSRQQIPPARTTVVSGKSLSDLGALLRERDRKNAAQPEHFALSHWEDATEEEPPEETDEEAATASPDNAACLRVNVMSRRKGKGALYLRVDSLVECVRPAEPDRIVKVSPAALKPGDVLPRVDERGRTTLFETIVAIVDQQPAMRFTAALRHQWQIALRKLAERYGGRDQSTLFLTTDTVGLDYARLLRDLRKAGATIETEQAVRSWIIGDVIGPESVASIIAVGRISGVGAVVANAKDFDRAFRRIRGVHQSVGRRLASAIRHSFQHFREASPEPLAAELDEHLAVPLAELLDSADLAEVVIVERVPVRVSPQRVGRFMNA